MNYVLCWLFLLETCCLLFFHNHNCRTFIFSSWKTCNKLHVFFYLETSYRLIYCLWNIMYYFIIIFFFLKNAAYCFFREIWCMLILFMKKCCMWIISSRNLMYLNLCLRETCYIFIFSSWNFLHVKFSLFGTCTLIFFSWNRFYLWNFLRVDFCSENLIHLDIFSTTTLLYVELFFRETQFTIVFFLLKYIACWCFLVKNDTCWFLFVKPTTCSLFSSRNLIYLDLCLRESCCIFIYSSWNLLYADFSYREIWFSFLVKLVLFVELVSTNWLLLIYSLTDWLLLRKVNLSRNFSLWNLLYDDSFFRET